jgi:hypothetical protein
MNDVLAMQPVAAARLPFAADTDSMFADRKGEYRKGVEKRQRKLAAKVAFIGRFLQPKERVLFVTTACSPFTTLEQLTTGAMILYLKRALLVVTDTRILQVLTNGSYVYRDSIAEIRYADCASMTQSFSALKVKYRNGKNERFLYVASAERGKFKQLLKSKTFESNSVGSGGGGRTHLCPRCAKPLQHGKYSCGACNLQFKSRAEGRRLALIFPGGGYFYTGHWFLGIGDAVTELVLIVFLILSLMTASGGEEGAWVTTAIVAVFLAFEKAISLYHTDHFIEEYLPAEKLVLPHGSGPGR